MKVIYLFFIFLLSFNGFSQNRILIESLNENFGEYQFYQEINEVLNLMKQKNKQRVDIELKEYHYGNEHAVMICEQTSNTILNVTKYYKNNSSFSIRKYECVDLFGYHLPKNSELLSMKRISGFNCINTDKEHNQKIISEYRISNREDSTIVEIIERRTGLYDNSKDSSIVAYFFDKKGRYIGNSDGVKITYNAVDSLSYIYEFPSNIEGGDSTKWIENYVFSETKEITSDYEYLMTRTKERKTRGETEVYREIYTLKYTLNEDKLPKEIEVLYSNRDAYELGGSDKVQGSKMIIRY